MKRGLTWAIVAVVALLIMFSRGIVTPADLPSDLLGWTGWSAGRAVAEQGIPPTTPLPSPNPSPGGVPEPGLPPRSAAASPVGPSRLNGATSWSVDRVIDGDTIDVRRAHTVARVRVIGIDSPERGECGYDAAARSLERLTAGGRIELVPVDTKDDTDRYGRLLRYVIVHPERGAAYDAGYRQIRSGVAVARYDSRDGYEPHPQENAYILADLASRHGYSCGRPASGLPPAESAGDASGFGEGTVAGAAAAGSAGTARAAGADARGGAAQAAGAEPWNRPGPDLDCSHIGHPVRISGPDYHRLDRDRDGIGCE